MVTSFTPTSTSLKLEAIGSLRRDANLRYLNQDEYLGRGRPRKYAGKVDLADYSDFELVTQINSSLTALNLAKWHAVEQHDSDANLVFSMTSYKRRALNYHLLERFIDKLDLEPTLIKSHPNHSSLCDYRAIAA
jgi:hypothetical protein